MGTNYYLTGRCSACEQEHTVHLGKSSGGWKFLLYDQVANNWSGFKKVLKDQIRRGKHIINEYGEGLGLKEFIGLVESKQTEENKSYDIYEYDNSIFLDKDGYEFNRCEFT